jgi:hypothetical protein
MHLSGTIEQHNMPMHCRAKGCLNLLRFTNSRFTNASELHWLSLLLIQISFSIVILLFSRLLSSMACSPLESAEQQNLCQRLLMLNLGASAVLASTSFPVL